MPAYSPRCPLPSCPESSPFFYRRGLSLRLFAALARALARRWFLFLGARASGLRVSRQGGTYQNLENGVTHSDTCSCPVTQAGGKGTTLWPRRLLGSRGGIRRD